jgi:hypothetical protein
MGIGMLGVLALLVQAPECEERFELRPSTSLLGRDHSFFHDALREDLVCPGEGARVFMVTTASVSDRPETSVFIQQHSPAKARITVRRYRENLWFAMHGWLDPRAPSKRGWATEKEQRAALAAARNVDIFEADIDTATFEAIARVWSLMIDRARPDPRRPKFIVKAHVSYDFQSGDRFANGTGRATGGAAEQLIALGSDLIAYASAPPAKRPAPAQLAAAAAALEARVKGLQACPPTD